MAGIGVNQKIMLHLDGVDESTTFTDSSLTGHSTSAIGTAQIDTAITDPWGGNDGVLLLDGNSDGVSVDDSAEFDLANYDFAIDCRVRLNSLSGNHCFAGRATSGTSYFYFAMESGAIRLRDYVSGNVLDLSFGSPSLVINTWYHFAITRDGNNIRFFIDGVQFGSTQTSSATLTNRSDPFQVGCNTVIGYFVNGQISEFRLTIGDSVWTSNFTPSSSPYTLDTDEETTINETVVWNDTFDWPQGTSNYGQKIISINPLVFVSYESPAKITKVNVSVPASPSWQAVEILGLDSAKDCVYNSNSGYVYVLGANGKVAKIELDNILNQTIINTGETDNLEHITCLEDYSRIFISTNDSDGEIVMIDESTMATLNTDLRILKQIKTAFNSRLDIILGKILNTDLRIFGKTTKVLNTDLRILKYAYTEVSRYPLDDDDILLYINGVEMTQYNDVDRRSISITFTEGNKSTASFKLNRRHDKLNYTFSNISSEITDNNAVIITINGNTIFSGEIETINAESETESVVITAQADEPDALFNSVTIPMATLNDDCHLYQCFMHNPMIENPVLNTQAIITNTAGKFWNGTNWTGNRNEALVFDSFVLANAFISGKYDLQKVYPINKEESPEYYKGVFALLGYKETQNVLQYSTFLNITSLAEEVEAGTFKPKSTWSYFWFGRATNFNTGDSWATMRYIGTGLNSLLTDTWKIDGLSYKYQKRLDNIIDDLGYYTLGSEPFLFISPRNGQFIPKDRWEDKGDGLYRVRDEGYNYVNYAKEVAALEYSKLKTINDEIFPRTSATIELSLDGYFYYNIHLLTRINVSNTTTSNIYNGNNGFPVAVKSITINTSNMKVLLSCDNLKSFQELQKIDENAPDANDEKYDTDAESVMNYPKYDINVSTSVPISS